VNWLIPNSFFCNLIEFPTTTTTTTKLLKIECQVFKLKKSLITFIKSRVFPTISTACPPHSHINFNFDLNQYLVGKILFNIP
jgi:hypothetical protein